MRMGIVMAAGLTTVDYAVLGIFLAAMVILGAWAGRRQSNSEDFFLAGRSLGWWPLGISLAGASLAAAHYCAAPNEAYWVGLKLLLVPVLIWAALPLVLWCVVPLYGNLELDSVYEYLELRYDAATRAVGVGIYLLGSLLWLGGLLALPCRILAPHTHLNVPTLLLLVGVGGTATLYTFLGGMRASVWTDVAEVALIGVALGLLVFFLAGSLDGGLPRIWEVSTELGRDRIVAPTHGFANQWSATAAEWSVWAGGWSIWAAVPYFALVPIFMFVADQATLQRLLAARDDRQMEISYLLGCGLPGLMIPAAMYVGMGLLAVYHDHAQQEIPPGWVVQSARDPDTDAPLIGPDTAIDSQNVGELVARGWILDPNTNRPMVDAEGLVNARGEVVIDRLATRATRKFGGERRLRAGGDRLLARFVKRHLPQGLRGVVLAALAAAVMAALDSGIASLATVAIVDLHRRFGWAERWLARQCRKPPDRLDQGDELQLGRPLVLILGAATIVVSLVAAEWGAGLGYLFVVMNLFAGPTLGVFLLGLFTRRTTGPAASAAMLLGLLAAGWATWGHRLAASAGLASAWPFDGPLGPFWPLPFGLAATLAAGYLLSFLVGSRKSRDELAGLVVGLGPLGILLELEEPREEEIYWIEIDEKEGGGPWA